MLDLSNYFTLGDKWLYDTLSKEKRESFPIDYKLDVLYTQDQFNNNLAVGNLLSRLQEYLSILDIPNFFVRIYTNKQDIDKDLIIIKNIFTPTDVVIVHYLIEGIFNKAIIKKDSICILPWMHLHINPQGQIGPCCQFDSNYPIGEISSDNLKEVVNNTNMKNIRKQMLEGQRPSTCNNCWIQEDQNLKSLRQESNEIYKKHFPLIQQTNEAGEFKNFKLKFFDFRTSNVCNLKCRMCGGKFSSQLAKEEIKLYPNLYPNKNFVELKLDSSEVQNILNFIENSINDLECIYFAGGEPLLMHEHYKILDFLIQHDRTDVVLFYNTNLSTLTYKKSSIIDYWKKFTDVTVMASIDLINERAEYVRSGVAYHSLEQNYLAIKDYVKFKIDSTLTIYNSFDLMKLQYRWIQKFGLSPNVFNIRIALLPPGIMSCQVLPAPIKKLVSQEIHQHIDWLLTVDDSKSLVIKWHDVLYFMNSDDQSHLLKDFFRLNDDKDRIRGERFEDVFTEFQTLRSYV